MYLISASLERLANPKFIVTACPAIAPPGSVVTVIQLYDLASHPGDVRVYLGPLWQDAIPRSAFFDPTLALSLETLAALLRNPGAVGPKGGTPLAPSSASLWHGSLVTIDRSTPAVWTCHVLTTESRAFARRACVRK